MAKAAFSAFLEERRAELRKYASSLEGDFGYASVLATDCRGLDARSSADESEIRDGRFDERGFVFRVQRGGRVAEWAADELDSHGSAYPTLKDRLEALLSGGQGERYLYPPLSEEGGKLSWRGEFQDDPFGADPGSIVERLRSCAQRAMSLSQEIVFAQSVARFGMVSKLFISPRAEFDQAYLRSEASVSAVAARGGKSREYYRALSGLAGLELLDGLPALADPVADGCVALLNAGAVAPGEYDVICAPDVAGLVAHEAFGHGVETDMFAKGRAKAAEYMGKSVASRIVSMYDGAAGAQENGSYAFDDEGTPARKTLIIDRGILGSGISDKLSAAALGLPATGNGRRQAFSHKAYARMTNTYFSPGTDRLADMIASVEKGYLLETMSSGMEDPKNWGIQMVVLCGREILGGRLTGRLASPVICTGYVPDVLSAVSMVSGDFCLAGNGYCGKGYKEMVKVSSGGPYIKTRMRLG